ncbi:hypothetical protein AFCDBAGC_5049 [Methylobacterium cerastii]|uniref:Uncharacterized protein n=1 Tax=Methylobacterium cerastii TaxID=932741 RepID=A0ABQ4QPE3_9HYPH|nr:hypothetical protein [Methylobacterium cerastii]GJD47163.1 hypothetical protein AFCDBAGC_5049 [Methylobacterium cerastii]
MYAVELLYYPAFEQGNHVGWAFILHKVNSIGEVDENGGPWHAISNERSQEFKDWWEFGGHSLNLLDETELIPIDNRDVIINLQVTFGAPKGFGFQPSE